MKRRDPSLKFDEDSHKVKVQNLADVLNCMNLLNTMPCMLVAFAAEYKTFSKSGITKQDEDGLAKQITVDHDPQGEKDAVESRGGFVLKKPGNIPRVDGQLAMTRAFGDRKLKEHITSEPDKTVKKIDAETDFIILASDGLWKVMSNQEAYDCIEELDDAQEAADELIKEALPRKS